MLKLLASLLLSCCVALGVSLSPAAAMGVYDLPILSSGAPTYVVDPVSAISAANEGKLNKDLKNLAEKTGQEVRMVVVRRLDYGQKIDNLADDILREWYPNPEDRANQTIIVLDTLTNKTAMRVSILSETMAVPLKDGGKYNQALLDASRRLTAVLSGEADPGPPEVATINIESTFTTAEETDDKSATIWVIVLLVLATVIPMATYFWYAGFGR
ncbi:MAG: YgcG family protein [Microcystis aeruginosa SX13-11]|nr:YgcG family protein [Microcystis aeruginosa SX13-11]